MVESEDSELRIDAVLDGPEAGGLAIRGGAIRIIGFGLASLLGLVSVPLLTRHLGPASYGDFVAVTAIAFIVGGFADAGLTNIGIREFSVRPERERGRLLSGLLGLRLLVTSFGVAIATALVALTGAAGVIVIGTLITGAALVITLMQVTYTIPLTAELRFGRITGLELLRQGATTLAVVLLVVAGASLVPFFWTAVFAAVVTLAATLFVVGRSDRLWPSLDWELFRSLAREAVPYTVALAGGFLYFRLAVVIMSYIAPASETGYYGAAFRIIEVIGVLPWLAVSAAFPILSRAAVSDEGRMRFASQQLFQVSVVVGTGMSLALAVGAPVAIAVVAGGAFEPAVGPLRILAVAQLTLFLVATGIYSLLALRRYREIMVATLLATGVTVAGTFALEPSLGASGAAVATAAADATLAVVYIVVLARIDRGLLPSARFIPRFLLLVGVAGAAGFLLLGASPLLAAIVAMIVYLAGALALRLVPEPLLAALPVANRLVRSR